MEDARFDALAERLGRGVTRRGAFGLLAGVPIAAHFAVADTDARKRRKKRRKKKKKKPNRCLTFGNVTVICPKGTICCDPVKSTGAGCAEAGYPVCCVSTGFAYEADIVCCDSASAGSDGVCDTQYPICCPGPPQSVRGCCRADYPNCCPESIDGCCEDGYPLCCSNATFGEYCCPQGTSCCETDPFGCCPTTSSAASGTTHRSPHGAWQPARRNVTPSGGQRRPRGHRPRRPRHSLRTGSSRSTDFAYDGFATLRSPAAEVLPRERP